MIIDNNYNIYRPAAANCARLGVRFAARLLHTHNTLYVYKKTRRAGENVYIYDPVINVITAPRLQRRRPA